MSQKQIQFDVLKRVVDEQSGVFATKDVSANQRMQDAHPELAKRRNYHSFVGIALSEHRVALGIDEVRKHTSGGSRWEKKGLLNAPHPPAGKTPAAGPVPSEGKTPELGPQYSGDSRFAAQMRRHQSWYRAHVLRVPCGTGPKFSDTSHYGNMLTRADGEAGRNFLTPEIAQVARGRVAQGGGTVEPFRLFNNMLSSQPMCFNLFGPLVNDRALARQLLSPIVPENVAEVTRVEMEWAPQSPEAYLGDRTAFDTFIEYRTSDGRLCAIGVETKLTEPFSKNDYDGERYRRWMRVSNSPWRPEADATVHEIQHNQLWRDHLLAIALRHQPNTPYATTRLMLVRHPADRECAHVLAGYRRLLRDNDDSLIDMPLDRIIGIWTAAVSDGSHCGWIHEFRLRYLELEKSAQ